MTNNKPIVFFDFETTGTDPFNDRAVSLTLMRRTDGEQDAYWNWLFHPERPIPPEATSVHGITDEMVAMCKPFREVAHLIAEFIGESDLAGYNIVKFDVPLLVMELERAGIIFDWRQRVLIDACNIFRAREPRDLTAAVKFYCGKDWVGAHDSLADVKATAEVFAGQLEKYPDLAGMSRAEIGRIGLEHELVDLAGKIGLNAQGQKVFNFGKSKGKRVAEDRGFAEWMLRSDFCEDTKRVVRECLG